MAFYVLKVEKKLKITATITLNACISRYAHERARSNVPHFPASHPHTRFMPSESNLKHKVAKVQHCRQIFKV